ncbi:serine/threonine protein kinase [Nocardioides anomalus]|uniref:Serine/threonine protein kinase n=1 Tax=Nocardioides anomalus TaxID=2712223 RepID=A0A6G6WAP4_9ACTN|nr:serine/threonine-protein kinase [Nocardioides anomalus]QIG42279.1 serine/threonine protein kinase [Nocardioides anomalus]
MPDEVAPVNREPAALPFSLMGVTSTPRTPARGVPAASYAPPATAAAPTVGGYTLLAKIGEGGMGVVHLARRTDGPRVALKVLRPAVVGDDEARRRLAREVSSLRRIKSKWVAEILDADPWAPVPYVATRYVPGLSLHDHVHEEGPITGKDLTWFAACLAEGVASVHAVGVLHRDVKPSNVLMEGRTPILIDFGLARVADDPKLTHTGWLLGTPGYLAPEILYGDDATTASDVHSWAATVAFAATAKPPFGRGPSMAIMDRVRRGEHDLSGIPEPLRQLLTEALDPDPVRRPELPAILGWLRPQVVALQRPATPVPPPPPAAADRLTLPYAAAQAGADVTPTDRMGPSAPAVGPAPAAAAGAAPAVAPRTPAGVTRPLTEHQTVLERQGPPTGRPVLPVVPVQGQAPLAERTRRATLLGVLALLCGGVVAAYPWLGSGFLLLAVWVLRSGSQAASHAGERRRLRGRRWYDGALLVLRSPWELIRSLPVTVMLQLWSAGLAVAAALLCYAFVAGESITLFVCGTVFAASVWTGPGGFRVRSPLARVVHPVARGWKPWLAVTFVLLVLATSLGALAQARGSSWAPAQDRPLAGRSTTR